MAQPSSFPHGSGDVLFLSGPSSTGKSTFSKKTPGVIHLEADQFLAVLDLNFVAKHRGSALSIIKDTFQESHPKPEEVLNVITGKAPEVKPKNQDMFESAKSDIKALLDDRWTSVSEKGLRMEDPLKAKAIWQEVFIAMLDKAQTLSGIGQTVIIDQVGMMGEGPEASAPELEPIDSSFWTYKGMPIKQLLKYATIDRVSQNILSRNVAGDKRDPIYVLMQYTDRFKKAGKFDETIDQLDASLLDQWVERFQYMKYFEITPSLNVDEIDRNIQEKKQDLSKEKSDALEKEIKTIISGMREKMDISETDTVISLTYQVTPTKGIYPKPEIIK